MELQFGIAKINKYAVSESGDTFEMVERPNGGMSLVLVDGQRSGKSAKRISNMVARKAIQLLSEGVRDGAAARAAHDYLYTSRAGKVSATLNIVSVDMESKTLVVTRNNASPVIVHTKEDGIYLLDEPSMSVGTRKNIRPAITEIPISEGMVVVSFTDGLIYAGSKFGAKDNFDVKTAVSNLITANLFDAQLIANSLMSQALDLDETRPQDDISVLVVSVLENKGDLVRRVSGRVPLR